MAQNADTRQFWYNWVNKLLNQWLVETNISRGIYGVFERDTYKDKCAKRFAWLLVELRLVPRGQYLR